GEQLVEQLGEGRGVVGDQVIGGGDVAGLSEEAGDGLAGRVGVGRAGVGERDDRASGDEVLGGLLVLLVGHGGGSLGGWRGGAGGASGAVDRALVVLGEDNGQAAGEEHHVGAVG